MVDADAYQILGKTKLIFHNLCHFPVQISFSRAEELIFFGDTNKFSIFQKM